MIIPSKIKLREYIEQTCVKFTYDLVVDSSGNPEIKTFTFCKDTSSNIWTVETCFDFDKLLKIPFELPKNNLTLEMIAAIGLQNIKIKLLDEAVERQCISFSIAEVTKGMIG